MKLHCFILLGNVKILTKILSKSSVTLLNKIEVSINDIKGFVTAVYKDK